MEVCSFTAEKSSSALILACTGSEVSVIRCLLSGLSSDESGGGLSAIGSGPVTINGTSITSCSSGRYGGGSYLENTGNTIISLSCYSNTTSSSDGFADYETINPSTISQELSSFFEARSTRGGQYVIYPDCSLSSHKNINVSHCNPPEHLICLSAFTKSLSTIDFSSFVSNMVNEAFLFNALDQSASKLSIISNTQTSSSYLFYSSYSGRSIALEDSVLISNSYSALSSGISISFPSSIFFNCSFTSGTSEKPPTLQHSLVYFDEVNNACLTFKKTNPFSEKRFITIKR